MCVNAKEIGYEGIEILGHKGFFTNLRVARETVPKGLYAYDLRDACDGIIYELKDNVTVNHFGTCLLKEKIEDSDKGIEIKLDDYNFDGVTYFLGSCDKE